MKFVSEEYAKADGPDLTIDAIDEQSKTKSRLQAPHFYAVMMEKENKVKRIDATGGVKYFGERPVAGKEGHQIINFSGSKGTYFKQEGRLALDGPVNYYVEQPVDKDVKEWARGTADKATYDETKKLLRLEGNVKFTYLSPGLSPKAQPPVEIDYLEIDMTAKKYSYSLGPGTEIRFQPKPETKKDKDKP